MSTCSKERAAVLDLLGNELMAALQTVLVDFGTRHPGITADEFAAIWLVKIQPWLAQAYVDAKKHG